MTCFIAIFALFWWSGTEPTISLRYAYTTPLTLAPERKSKREGGRKKGRMERQFRYKPNKICTRYIQRNSKTLMKEIKDDLNKWRDISCS